MQDITRMRVDPTTSHHHRHHHASPNHARAINLFHTTASTSEDERRIESASEEDSGIELNSCRRLMDKPPLVKRLTMGLLKAAEDRSPLVVSSLSTRASQDGYVNEGVICDPISSTFGESCNETLAAAAGNAQQEHHHQHLRSATGNGTSHQPMLLQQHQQQQQQQQQLQAQQRQTTTNNGEFEYKRNVFHSETYPVNLAQRFPPAVPIRNDSLSLYEQNELKGASWFQAGIPREISLEVLSRQQPGAFLVRQSTTKPGCFALSLRVPPPAPAKVAHYLILRTIRGYKIKGFTKEFTTLTALITHHSVMPELLPVPLSLPRLYATLPSKQNGDDFEYGDLGLGK